MTRKALGKWHVCSWIFKEGFFFFREKGRISEWNGKIVCKVE